MSDEKKEKIKVRDKRGIDDQGQLKEEIKKEPPHQETKKEEKKEAFFQEEMPEINFSTFIFSLGSAALMGLGLIPNPHTNIAEKDLILAKQNIDLLALLKEKTKGNLTKDEETLVDNLLYDVRMRYVEATKNKG